jgi:hypothetical protein
MSILILLSCQNTIKIAFGVERTKALLKAIKEENEY